MYIMLIVFSGLFFAGAIIALVDWRKLAEKWVANNPANASVYVAAGEQVDRVNGRLAYPGIKGSIYLYKWHKIALGVYVKDTYPYRFIRGRRMINVFAGHGISISSLNELVAEKGSINQAENEIEKQAGAAPLDWKAADKQVTVSASDLDAVVRSNIGVSLVNSLTGKKVSMFLIMALVVVAIVGGLFFYNNFMKKEAPVEPSVPPGQTSENIPPGMTMEEYLRLEGVIK